MPQHKKKALPSKLAQRIEKSKIIADAAKARVQYVPKPTAVYLKSIRRGPIGAIQKALRECLISWALLGISLIGGSISEIITDSRLKDRLVTSLKIMGIVEVRDFDIFEGAKKMAKCQAEKAGTDTTSDLEMAARRMASCVKETRSPYGRKWCSTRLAEAKNRLQVQQAKENVNTAKQPGPQTTAQIIENSSTAREALDAPSAKQNEWIVVKGRKKRPATCLEELEREEKES